MTAEDILRNVIAGLALVVSLLTAYKTLFARFRGKVGASNRLILTQMDGMPSIGLACCFENAGAKPGILDDMRLRVKHSESGAIYYFFPQLIRDTYSIYATYREADWFPFSRLSLPSRERTEKFVLFKPLNNKFTAEAGSFEVTLEARFEGGDSWWGTKKWNGESTQSYKLSEEISTKWNSRDAPAIQVLSTHLLDLRSI